MFNVTVKHMKFLEDGEYRAEVRGRRREGEEEREEDGRRKTASPRGPSPAL